MEIYNIYQLKAARNAKGDRLVFFLNKMLKDWACSKPNAYAISLRVHTGQSTQQHIHEKLIGKAKEWLSTIRWSRIIN